MSLAATPYLESIVVLLWPTQIPAMHRQLSAGGAATAKVRPDEN
jgi:hypothetical protein